MINVFEDINKGNFIKVGKLKEIAPSDVSRKENLNLEADHSMEFLHGQVVDLQMLKKLDAKRTEGDIQLENISVITPSGDVVVPDLSLQVCHL